MILLARLNDEREECACYILVDNYRSRDAAVSYK